MSIATIIIAIVLFVIGIGLGWGGYYGGGKKASETQEETSINTPPSSVVDESILAEKDEQLHTHKVS